MPTEIIPLGVASAMPASGRHPAALALRCEGKTLLFDCGEGTQMQLVRAGLKRTRIDAIFITHFHGDHFFGLMGLLTTLALLNRSKSLTVVGPPRIASVVSGLPGLAPEDLSYDIEYVELEEDFDEAVVWETPRARVVARPLKHRVFTAGYRWEEKPQPGHLDVAEANRLGVSEYADYRRLKAGETVTLPSGIVIRPEAVVGPPQEGSRFAYVTDTRPCDGGRAHADGVEVLCHEATFAEDLSEKAVATGHSTAREAAEVAREAGAARLLIGLFSARYSNPDALVAEARQTFANTEAAEELKRYVLR